MNLRSLSNSIRPFLPYYSFGMCSRRQTVLVVHVGTLPYNATVHVVHVSCIDRAKKTWAGLFKTAISKTRKGREMAERPENYMK
jgi:hypothetical protein